MKLSVFMAAAPLFQLSQCETFSREVAANVANNLPATIFSITQSILLSPIIALLSGEAAAAT